ncbi:MAG: PEGA domain-containing protein [Polyangiaceae bacterium]
MSNKIRQGRSRFAMLMAAGACFVAVPAAAEPKAAAPLSQSLSGEAKSAYESGKLLVDDGDFAGALTKFKRSYDVSKDARLLWNMAVCEKEQRHYARAATLVSRYLKEGGALISVEQRRSATDTQNALRAFYSSVKLSGVRDGATVLVDGVTVGFTPLAEPLLLDLGTRRVRVEASGYEPFEKSIDVSGNNQLEVPVVLTAAAAAAAGVVPPRLSVTSAGERDIVSVDAKVVGSRHWEGVLSVGEHTVRVTAAHKKPYEIQLQLSPGTSRSLQVALEDEGHRSTLWYWVAGGATLTAGAIVGGYFLLKPKEEPGTHPTGALTTVFLPTTGTASQMGGGQR